MTLLYLFLMLSAVPFALYILQSRYKITRVTSWKERQQYDGKE